MRKSHNIDSIPKEELERLRPAPPKGWKVTKVGLIAKIKRWLR